MIASVDSTAYCRAAPVTATYSTVACALYVGPSSSATLGAQSPHVYT